MWDGSGNWQGAPEAIERAIYDGLYADALDEEWESPIMYKMQGKEFKVSTFPDQVY